MGNYFQLEIDFVKRTLALIDQYEFIKEEFPFGEQYSHTLLTNCLLGLIVLPKERAFTNIPKTRLEFVRSLRVWGIKKSTFNPHIRDTKELFHRLRNAVAHFGIEFISDTEEYLIDRIKFIDPEAEIEVAVFYTEEFIDFIRFYASTLIQNMEQYG